MVKWFEDVSRVEVEEISDVLIMSEEISDSRKNKVYISMSDGSFTIKHFDNGVIVYMYVSSTKDEHYFEYNSQNDMISYENTRGDYVHFNLDSDGVFIDVDSNISIEDIPN